MSDPFKILLKTASENPVHKTSLGLVDRSGKYSIGEPSRPSIKHDNGHLDNYKKRDPTVQDRVRFEKWRILLIGSELSCTARIGSSIDLCNKEDMVDANEAYRHFLFGNGADRLFDYERFLKMDASAADLIKNLISDFKKHVEVIGVDRLKFSVTSEAFTVGRGGIAPYPSTANWQKAIGAHFLWVSANIYVSAAASGIIRYHAEIKIHVEDRYNFNPGSIDIATGIPDSDNGTLEITGLAHQYTQYSTIVRNCEWEKKLKK